MYISLTLLNIHSLFQSISQYKTIQTKELTNLLLNGTREIPVTFDFPRDTSISIGLLVLSFPTQWISSRLSPFNLKFVHHGKISPIRNSTIGKANICKQSLKNENSGHFNSHTTPPTQPR